MKTNHLYHGELYFNEMLMMSALYYTSSSSLKQQSVGRHVGPLGHIILIPNQPVFDLTPSCCVHQIPIW